jgi:hypothetical protein
MKFTLESNGFSVSISNDRAESSREIAELFFNALMAYGFDPENLCYNLIDFATEIQEAWFPEKCEKPQPPENENIFSTKFSMGLYDA